MGRRGSAMFTWTTPAGQEAVHHLGQPLRTVKPRRVQSRYVTEGLDGSAFDVVTVGDELWELEATIRQDQLPDHLLALIADGWQQQTLTYIEDATGRDEFDALLVPGGSVAALEPDSDFWFRGEYEITVRLRRTDGGTFASLTHGAIDGKQVVGHLRGGEPLDLWSLDRTAVSGADTYTKRDGTVGEVTTDDIARTHWLDTDSDGVFETSSYLLELSRENLLPYSEAFDNAAWTKARVSITADQHTAPDGTNTADRLVEDGTASVSHLIVDTATATADATYTLSVYAKDVGGGRNWLYLAVDESGLSNAAAAYFNVATGAVGNTQAFGTGAFVDAYTEDAGNGWYRCVLVGSVGNSVTSVLARIHMASGNGLSSYSGDGSSYLAIWGAQFEDASEFATSYIATTGATVTRNAETFSRILPTAIASPRATWTRYLRWEAGMDGSGGISDVRFSQIGDGTIAASGKALALIAPSATSIRLQHANGSSTNAATITGLSISRGDECEAIHTWDGSDGTGTLYLWINGTYIDSATLSGITPASAWEPDGSGDVRTYVNSRDGGNNAGAMALLEDVFTDGVVSGTAAQIRSKFRRHVEQE